MKHKKKNKPVLKLRTALFKGSFIHNPILTQAIGICPIIAVASTAMQALCLSFTVFVLLTVTEALTSLFLKKVPRYIRVALYTLLSSAVILLIEPLISEFTVGTSSGMGIYIYLLAVNGLIAVRNEKFACKTTLRNSLTDAFASSVGYTVVALLLGIIREVLTYGTVFGFDSSRPVIPAASMPFVALMIVGIIAAVHKAYIIRFHPDEQRDTFSLASADEKPVWKDPGLGKNQKKAKIKAKSDDTESFDQIRPRYSIEDLETDDGSSVFRQEDDNA